MSAKNRSKLELRASGPVPKRRGHNIWSEGEWAVQETIVAHYEQLTSKGGGL